MIMIRKNAPRVKVLRKPLAYIQQPAFTFSHSVRRPNYAFVLVTGTRDHELKKPCEFPMRRRVPGAFSQATILDSFTSLRRGHFPIVIHLTKQPAIAAYRVPTLVGLS